MKTKIIFVFVLFISSIVFSLDIGGDVSIREIWYLKNNIEKNQDNFHSFNINFIQNLEENINFKTGLKIRLYDYINPTNLNDIEQTLNYTITPWQLWIKIKDIPFKGLSLKIGKQYFEWGTADGINPSSVLNPNDWSNPFGIGNKIPITAFNLNYTFKFIQLFAIWIPSFKPDLFPKYFQFSNTDCFEIPGITLLTLSDTINLPEQNNRSEYAFKINFSVSTIDFSFGYFSGYDSMPQIKSFTYSSVTMTQWNLHIDYFFPELNVYTIDFSTSVAGLGLWGEIGIYDYNKETINITTPVGNYDEVLFDGKPYASYIFGMDYTFINGWYGNLQYSYGLPYVRGWKNFEDYILFDFKIPIGNFFNLNLMNIFGFKRDLPIKDNYEYMLDQHLDYDVSDNTTISIYVSEINAYGKTLFKNWENYDSIGFEIKYNF